MTAGKNILLFFVCLEEKGADKMGSESGKRRSVAVESKKEFRREMKEKLAKMNKWEYEQSSFEIARRLFAAREWKEAETVAVTVSIFPEVDTLQIIRRAWLDGKQVAVPKCVPGERRLDFRLLTSFTQLERGYGNLFEPKTEETAPLSPGQLSLVIVPGLAFTKGGHRLGFGGGYYDRFLAGYRGEFLALAFERQLVPKLPVEAHDVPIPKIVTEKEVYRSC